MAKQLDILALEPFYGGARRSMLETIVRCSRHRWTVLKLPPRRIERRLTAAAVWFAEQLKAHWSGRFDVLFTSEALNLSNLFQLMPALAEKPSAVYFHGNQLPSAHQIAFGEDGWLDAQIEAQKPAPIKPPSKIGKAADAKPFEFVNLNTAAAASEIWFNSHFHRQDFFARAAALVSRSPDLAVQNPLPPLAGKSQLLPPPIDVTKVTEAQAAGNVERDTNTLFVETRDADLKLLNTALAKLRARGEKIRLITVGPLDGLKDLAADVQRRTLPENAEADHARAMLESAAFVSVKRSAPCDFTAVRALVAGCRPVVPAEGVYPEIIPPSLQPGMYEPDADELADRISDATSPFQPPVDAGELATTLRPYEPIRACRGIDERLEHLVKYHTVIPLPPPLPAEPGAKASGFGASRGQSSQAPVQPPFDVR